MGCCVGNCCVVDCGFCCVMDFCSDRGSSCSYHPQEKITVDHSKKIADELAAMKKRAAEEGKKIGDEAFDNINQYMNEFLENLKIINANSYGGKKLNIKMDVIEKEIGKLRNEVANFIGDRLNERLILTDSELSVILEERDDKKRSSRFDDFYSRIHKKAVLDLVGKIEEVIAKQFSMVDTEIRTRLKEVDSSMQDALRSYNDAEKMKEQQDSALVQKQIDCMYRITVADILSDELKVAV